MDFREATDRLCKGVNHASLAKALGVSIPTIRQARLDAHAKARRHPPPNWEHGIIRLAEQQVWNSRKLIEALRARLDKADTNE
jgi:hypothetical protein